MKNSVGVRLAEFYCFICLRGVMHKCANFQVVNFLAKIPLKVNAAVFGLP